MSYLFCFKEKSLYYFHKKFKIKKKKPKNNIFNGVFWVGFLLPTLHRSDHAHLGQTFLHWDSLRGATWLLPLPSLPPLLYR
jgi:hypothetical protein